VNENERMPIRIVHVPLFETTPKAKATEVDAEVHLKPVEVKFQEYKPVKLQLNDKIPDLPK